MMPFGTETSQEQSLVALVDFLRRIGLTVTYRPGASGFTEGVAIENGALFVDPGARASTLAHEAGHLATIPEDFRDTITGDLSKGQRAMLEYADRHYPPATPASDCVLYCSDTEATAWAWAAGQAAGLDDVDIVQDDEYGGDGASIRLMLQLRQYVGIHGLAHAGWCATSEAMAAVKELPAYPSMSRWLMPATSTFSQDLTA